MSKALSAIVAIVVVAVIIVGAYLLYKGTLSSFAGLGSLVAIQMTDPATVPPGTSAMLVSYSSVQVLASTNNGTASQSSWVSAEGSGTVNVLALNGSARTIAIAYVQQNSTISAVRYNISSVMITVNGTSHDVTPEDSAVMVSLSGNGKVNSTTSAVVVDMAPTVTAQQSGTSTTYVMVANARAAVLVNANASVSVNTALNSTAQIAANIKSKLGLNLG